MAHLTIESLLAASRSERRQTDVESPAGKARPGMPMAAGMRRDVKTQVEKHGLANDSTQTDVKQLEKDGLAYQ